MRRCTLAFATWLGACAGCDARLMVGQLVPSGQDDASPPADAAPERGEIDAPPPECGAGPEAAAGTLALDVIFMVDNSSSVQSYGAEIARRLSEDFPRIMDERGIDYRVILLSRYGRSGTVVGTSESSVCITAPLGPTDCSDPEAQPLANHPPRFFQFSADVDSNVPLCLLLQAWNTPDEIPAGERPWTPVAPDGWSAFVRPGVFKAFVVVTDDEVVCSFGGYDFPGFDDAEAVAREFDRAITTLSPEHFGTPDQRNYAFFSIVGMPDNTPATDPWPPTAPLQSSKCGSSDNPGTSYQAISRMTGAARFSLCRTYDYDPIFSAVADSARPVGGCP
jgi:hypothetical protein